MFKCKRQPGGAWARGTWERIPTKRHRKRRGSSSASPGCRDARDKRELILTNSCYWAVAETTLWGWHPFVGLAPLCEAGTSILDRYPIVGLAPHYISCTPLQGHSKDTPGHPKAKPALLGSPNSKFVLPPHPTFCQAAQRKCEAKLGMSPPHPHRVTAVRQGQVGCWRQQGEERGLSSVCSEKREKKAKNSKTEQLSKEEPGQLHPQPHSAVHGIGIGRFLPIQHLPEWDPRAPSAWDKPNQSHDPMDAPGAGSSTRPSTTRTRWVDAPCHDAKHRSDRFFPQTHDITLLSRKITGVRQKS